MYRNHKGYDEILATQAAKNEAIMFYVLWLTDWLTDSTDWLTDLQAT